MQTVVGAPDYFDGSFPNGAGYDYVWEGTPHKSKTLLYMQNPFEWVYATDQFGLDNFENASSFPSDRTRSTPRGRDVVAGFYAGSRGFDSRPMTKIKLGTIGGGSSDRIVIDPLVVYSASIAFSIGRVGSYSGLIYAYIEWYGENGFISRSVGLSTFMAGSDAKRLTYTQFRTKEVTAQSPVGATRAAVGVIFEALEGDEISPSMTLLADTAILVIGNGVPEYFDGATPDDDVFTYEWEGEADRSLSLRVGDPLPVGTEPIIDPNCPPPPPAPLPPQLALGCATKVEEWRRVWYVIPPEEVYEWGSVLLNFTLNSGGEDVEEMRITLWPNPSGDDPFDFDDRVNYTGRWHVSYMPANSTMVINGTTRTVTTTPPDGVPRDTPDLVHGPGQGPILWPELRCGEQYLIAIDTPLGADYENIDLALELVRRFG